MKLLDELGAVSPGDGDQEATRGLRIECNLDESFAQGLFDGDLILQVIPVSLASAGDVAFFGETRRTTHNREVLRFQYQSHTAAAGHLEGVPENAVACDVGAGVN